MVAPGSPHASTRTERAPVGTGATAVVGIGTSLGVTAGGGVLGSDGSPGTPGSAGSTGWPVRPAVGGILGTSVTLGRRKSVGGGQVGPTVAGSVGRRAPARPAGS